MTKIQMTHTGAVSKINDFGLKRTIVVELRETKNHYMGADGDKYSKKTGRSSGGYTYKGIFIGDKLELDSVKPKELTNV